MSPQKRNAIVMIITEGLYFITYMTVKPYMKTLLNQAGATNTQTGVILALFGFIQVVSALVLSGFLQKYGQKLLMIIGSFSAVVMGLLIIFSNHIAGSISALIHINVRFCEIAILTVSNLMFGFVHGIILLGSHYCLTSLKLSDNRDKMLGFSTFFESLGQFVGPIFAGIILSSSKQTSYRSVVFMGTCLSIVIFILLLFSINIKLDTQKERAKLSLVFGDKPLMRLILINGAAYFASDVVISYMQDFGVITLGLTLAKATLVLSAVKLATMIIRFLLAPLINLFGAEKLFSISLFSLALSICFIGSTKFISTLFVFIGVSTITSRFVLVVIGACLYGAAFGLVNPLALMKLSDPTNNANRASALALRSMANYGGQSVGEIIFGFIITLTGGLSPIFFLSSAVLFGCMGLIKKK